MWLFRRYFLFLLIIRLQVDAQRDSCGISEQATGFIWGGKPADQGAWPWIVSLHYKNDDYFCGGTLVRSNVVITAAHCIQEKKSKNILHPEDLIVKLGKHDLSQKHERDSETRYINEIIIHPRWKYFTSDYDADIAILILDRDAKISSRIFPICVWDENLPPKERQGMVVGWGKSEFEGIHELKPRQVKLAIRTNEECFLKNKFFAEISSNSTFCAGRDETAGPCRGDSGSGLFIQVETKRWYLKGIVSSGFLANNECDVSVDTVFTDVIKHINWVSQIVLEREITLPKPNKVKVAVKPRKFEKEIFCFFEGWADGRGGEGAFALEHLKPELCTTLVFLHAELDGDTIKAINPWQETDENGIQLYKKFNGLKRSYRVRTLLALGSWNEGSVKYSQLAGNPERRRWFAQNSAEFLKDYGFDGLHLHWEHPAHRGGAAEDKENFPLLLKEIHDHYKSQDLYLSAFLRTQPEVVETAYDLKNIAQNVDAVLMMTFDFWAFWSGTVGYPAPIYGDGELNVDSRVNDFIRQGVPSGKIILGIPFFGRTYVARKDGKIGERVESGFNGPFVAQDGFLGHNEQCFLRKTQPMETTYNATVSQAIATYKKNDLTHVIIYDSPRTVANKSKYVVQKRLGGFWTWFVSTDDFRGDCEQDLTTFADIPNVTFNRKEKDFPLLRTIYETFEILSPKNKTLGPKYNATSFDIRETLIFQS